VKSTTPGDTLVINKPTTETAPATLNLSRHAVVSLSEPPFLFDNVTINVKGWGGATFKSRTADRIERDTVPGRQRPGSPLNRAAAALFLIREMETRLTFLQRFDR